MRFTNLSDGAKGVESLQLATLFLTSEMGKKPLAWLSKPVAIGFFRNFPQEILFQGHCHSVGFKDYLPRACFGDM